MQYSTNYNLNLVEGTDIVNPLVIDKPNYQTIDGAMKANKDAAVNAASHTKASTVHAIVRTNTDANVFRFVASAPFTAGDTFTVDGNAVTGINTAGEGLETNDFVIGASVLCVLNSGTLTLNVNKKPVIPATYDANDIVFDNTGTGLTATNAQTAIEEVNNNAKKPFAINNASLLAAITPIPYTPASGTAVGDLCVYYKVGTRVTVNVVISGATSGATILTLPSGYRPVRTLYTAGVGSPVYVQANGSVIVASGGESDVTITFDAVS